MHRIDINQTKLAYAMRGSGQAVVFIHGGFNDLRSWRMQMEAFGSQFRAISLSCRHFHPNDAIPSETDLPLDALVGDLATFIEKLDLSPAHLVGSSSGAFVCLLLGRRRPDLVRSLVLAEPPVMPLLGISVPPKPSELLKLLLRSPGTALEVVRFGATVIGPTSKAFAKGDDVKGIRTFARGVLGHNDDYLTEFVWRQARDNIPPFKAQLRAGFPPFTAADAGAIDVPTLLVTGEHSAPIHHRITDRLEMLMPDTERIDLRDASHLMYEDRPDAFNREVLRFLARFST